MPAVRTIVTDQSGNIVSDSGEPELEPELDLEELGEGVAETFEDLAKLARQSSRVAGRIQRMGKAISSVVGPLNRPLGEQGDTDHAGKVAK